jgi:hypothetical protein
MIGRRFDPVRVRQLRRQMSIGLTAWSVSSIVAGAAAVAIGSGLDSTPRAIVQAGGVQFVVWGLIDLVFGLFGLAHGATADEEREQQKATKLLRALRFNDRLNIAWLAAGAILLIWGAVAWSGRSTAADWPAALIGHGLGVLAQALFLAALDRIFLSKLSRLHPSKPPVTPSARYD